MDYQEDIKINENDLQREWLLQPNLYMKYAELLNKSQEDERNAKENIDIIKAQVDLEIRGSNPDKYNLDKFTESAIKSLIDSHLKIKNAKKCYNKKRKKAALLQAAINAIEQRKKALEFLSRFQLAGFNCHPNLEEMDEKIFKQKAQSRLKENMKGNEQNGKKQVERKIAKGT
jgi:hypothetical protein